MSQVDQDMPVNPSAAPARRAADTAFFGHPVGLFYLCLTEAWERFSFSGMQTLLVLYMVDDLFRPGHVERVAGFSILRHLTFLLDGPLTGQALASVVFGLYTSLVFLSPLFGGILGDRLFGQTRVVVAGALLMACGDLLLVFERSFLAGLLFLIVGAGCIKGNISVQVAGLYTPADRRSTNAFQIFAAGIDTGVIVAPLVCGTIGTIFGWRYGFLAAAAGMLCGLAIYLKGLRHLPADGRSRCERPATEQRPAARLAPSTFASLALVFLLVTLFLSSAGQLGNVYSLWVRARIDRHVAGFDIPIPWFQSLTPLFSVLLTPLILKLWARQAACTSRNATGREPRLVTKIAIGLALNATALAILASLSSHAGPLPWISLLPVHLLVAVAFLFVWPVGLAFFSQVAPRGYQALFIGLFFLSSFVAGNVVGRLGTLFGPLDARDFWALHAAISAAGALLALAASLLGKRRVMAAPATFLESKSNG